MKKILSIFLVLSALALQSYAQKSFEGTITFSMKVMGSGAEMMAAFMPTGSIHQYKGADYLMKFEGGMMGSMMGDILMKDGVVYAVKTDEKTAYKFEDEANGEAPPKPNISKEDEVIEILGYKCQKYLAETETPQGPVSVYVWATQDLKIAKPKTSGKSSMMMSSSLFMEGVDGVVLKKMTNIDAMGMTLTTVETVTEIKAGKLSKKLFVIPKNFAMKTGQELMEQMQQGMGGGN